MTIDIYDEIIRLPEPEAAAALRHLMAGIQP